MVVIGFSLKAMVFLRFDKFFNEKKEEPIKQDSNPEIQSSANELKPGYQWVELEDGTKAQVNIPEIMI